MVWLGPSTPISEKGSLLAGRMGWTAAKTPRTVTSTSATPAVSLSMRRPHHVISVESEPRLPVDPTSKNVRQGCDHDYRRGGARRGDFGRLSGSASRLRDRRR